MKVKECVERAAALLSVAEEVCDYLENGNEEGKEQTERLLECFQIVENELALDYLPLYEEEELESADGKVAYTTFKKHILRVVRVRRLDGENLPFRIFPTYMETEKGKLRVLYAYAPKAKTADEESDYPTASVRTFAYGMAANYCAIGGLYAEAAVWEKKYREGVAAAKRVRSAVTPARRWV